MHTFAEEMICTVDLYCQQHGRDPDMIRRCIDQLTILPASDLVEADILVNTWPNVPPQVRAVIATARILAKAALGPEEHRLAMEIQ